MASVNKAIIVGHLGQDIELRYLPNGDAVANLSIATTDTWKDKDGNKQEATEWHRVSFFGRQAEVCGQFLKKGSQVYVEGKIQTKKYTDKNGVEKYTTGIRGEHMQMLDKKGSEQSSGNSASKPAQNQSRSSQGAGPVTDDFVDDIPFNRISNKLAMSI